jgi:hypothetical protein
VASSAALAPSRPFATPTRLLGWETTDLDVVGHVKTARAHDLDAAAGEVVDPGGDPIDSAAEVPHTGTKAARPNRLGRVQSYCSQIPLVAILGAGDLVVRETLTLGRTQ